MNKKTVRNEQNVREGRHSLNAGQTISIRRFCGLEDIDIDVKPFLVLIGPQASGKSLIAKLLYFFQQALSGLVGDAVSCTDVSEYTDGLVSRFKLYFPPISWGGKGFEIDYQTDDFEIKVRRTARRPSHLKIEINDAVTKLFEGIATEIGKLKERERIKYVLEDDPDYVRHYISRFVKKRLPDAVSTNTLFVPAGRSFFANLDSAIWPILRKQKVIDPFLIDYGVHYQSSKNFYRFQARHSEPIPGGKVPNVEQRVWAILGGKLNIKRDQEFVEHLDGRTIPVTNLSSGQQELLPLLMGIFQTFPWMGEARKTSIFIEEPEAHLFPSAQKEVVQFILAGFNSYHSGASVTITTHSPYVLAALNNSLLASSIVGDDQVKGRKVAKVISRDVWLTLGCLSVYAIADGRSRSIIDDDIGLIDASFIDSVSRDIADEFDAIWELAG